MSNRKSKRQIANRCEEGIEVPEQSSAAQASANPSLSLAWKQLDGSAYFFLVICVISQAATILISWPVWQVRTAPPNLPWIAATPQIAVGVLLLISLGLVLITPKRFGMSIHLLVLFAAMFMDQFRCQPQILSVTFLMGACVWKPVRRLCVWYLVSMWLWAGIHKVVSPDWFEQVSFKLLNGTGLNALKFHYAFAWLVAISEIGLGVLAWFRPKLGAMGCVSLHVGITIFLLIIGWNYSVLPWNICTAIVGAWLLWNCHNASLIGSNAQKKTESKQDSLPLSVLPFPGSGWEKVAVAALLIIPGGLYLGLVRHCFTHSLYSANLPIAAMTRKNGDVETLESWEELGVPFPNERKAYIDYFALTAKPGEKLHIREPRKLVEGGYFLAKRTGVPIQIAEDQFFEGRNSDVNEMVEVSGVAADSPRKIFLLEKANATLLKRSEGAMIYAVKFDPDNFDSAALKFLDGLPNLEQVQLQDCEIVDGELKWLSGFNNLVGIGLNNTAISDAGLLNLKDLPKLEFINCDGTAITSDGLRKIGIIYE
jgi:hypothetical protein